MEHKTNGRILTGRQEPAPFYVTTEAGRLLPPAGDYLCPLTGFSLITVEGEDSFDFLNNNLSNDLAALPEMSSQLSSYCNPKGRMYCCLRIFKCGAAYYLRTTTALCAAVLDRLQMFVLRAKVNVALSPWTGIGLAGPKAGQLLIGIVPLPEAENAVACTERCIVIRLPDVFPCKAGHLNERYEIYASSKNLAAVQTALSARTRTTDHSSWRLLDVLCGFPNLYPETSERFVPQMVNLDLLGGISFSKGCYPGQEIVARTHYLGKLKRRMYAFSAPLPAAEPGTAVFVPAWSSEQPGGEVVDACQLDETSQRGLAVLRIQSLDRIPGTILRLSADNAIEARLESPPYKIIDDSFDPEKK